VVAHAHDLLVSGCSYLVLGLPHGAINDFLNRFCSLKKVPLFIRNYSIYLTGAGLAMIIYVEAAFHMTHSPMATCFLLLGIVTFAILSGFLYERRVWCRYLCPLGRLAGIFAGCSIIEWRSNASICNSTCKTNAYYKGTENFPGSPMYQAHFRSGTIRNAFCATTAWKSVKTPRRPAISEYRAINWGGRAQA
jgi:polyferredoxin